MRQRSLIMIKKAIIVAVLSAISLVASADFRTITKGYEIALSDLRLPVTNSGSVGVKNCESCDSRSLRVTTSTRYRINSQDVSLRVFRRQVLAVRDRNSKAVTVMYHLESKTVATISVSI